MGFDVEEAMEKRRMRREERLVAKFISDVSIVLADGESVRVGDIKATGLDDAITKARKKIGFEEKDIIRNECRAKNLVTGEVLNY